MKEALRKAIEGGWKPRGVSMGISNNGWSSFESMISLVQWQEITSDPLFWQCLGKSLGWINGYDTENTRGVIYSTYWLSQWHLFIDHLAEGKDADEFFKELLK